MKISKFVLIVSAALVLCGCKDKKKVIERAKNPAQVQIEVEQKSSDHKWFYFSGNSYVETDLPQHSPILSLKPWTESLRICDGNVDLAGKGILLVNHFGVLLFEDSDEPKLIQDSALFSDSTAGNLVFENNVPFFTLSRNSLFNKNVKNSQNQNPDSDSSKSDEKNHIIRLSLENSMFFPCVTYSDLEIQENEEVSGTYFDGKNWFSSIKLSEKGKTDFRYIKWSANSELASLSPKSDSGKITIQEISRDSYRKESVPKDFSASPARLKNLLSSLPDDFDFLLALHRNGGASPEYFYGGNQNQNSQDDGAEANAILTPEWICAIFGDGTAYFSGSLKGKPLINNGKTVAFRLPKLPKEYVYGDFCISGDFLAVSWEENDFYKTGRSGFLVVNMAEIF